MDNIVYTCTVPLVVGIFFGAIRHMHILYMSNTKLIIQQSDQIQFVLTRVIDLNKKIRMLEQKLEDLNEKEELRDIKEYLSEELKEDLKEEDDLNEEKYLKEETEEKEASFEIIENETAPIKTQKEKGWIRYLF